MSVETVEASLGALEAVAATRVRREWSAVREQLRVHKALALTAHDRVEAVLLDPAEYTALLERAGAADQALLRGLTERFDARLAALQQPDARARLLDAFDQNGQFSGVCVAGERF